MPFCDILAWCLMPNHFHLMIVANDETLKQATNQKNEISQFSENLRLMLSQYTKAVNRQENLIGSLFRQNTKSKCLNQINTNKYALACFHYIHRNPYDAKLVSSIADWEFSSYKDYVGMRNGNLCNKELSEIIFNFDKNNFEYQTLKSANSGNESHIW